MNIINTNLFTSLRHPDPYCQTPAAIAGTAIFAGRLVPVKRRSEIRCVPNVSVRPCVQCHLEVLLHLSGDFGDSCSPKAGEMV